MPPLGGTATLLDRERELARIDDALEAVTSGAGRVLVVRGQAGVGKTTLLERLRERAEAAGLRVCTARGGPLEQRFAFGVTRQLFERVLGRMPPASRGAAFAGAAAGAAAVMGLEGPPGEAAGLDLLRALHSLYWLCANLADSGGLALVVDDVHWADAESLRWLSYMANRVEDLPLFLAVGERTGEVAADAPSLAAIAAAQSSAIVQPGPLGEEASTRLVHEALGEEADGAFCRACHLASGGNPFYLRELVLEAERQGIEPVAAEAGRVGGLGPPAISKATVERLARLPAPAGELARAVAVLGLDAELRRAAELIGAEMSEAERAADALASAGILTEERPLNFRHPVVQAAIHADMPGGVRSELHGRAADMLAREQADAGVVASHLLLVDAAGDPTVLERLELAATDALRRGAPTTAATYLRRALDEPVTGERRAQILCRLGATELMGGHPDALPHLEEALASAVEAALVTEAAMSLCMALAFMGRVVEAEKTAAATIERLGDSAEDAHTLGLEGIRLQLAVSPYSTDPRKSLRRLLDIAERTGAAGRVVFLSAGLYAAVSVDSGGETRALVERGLDGGGFIADGGADSLVAGQAVTALAFVDELAAADELLDAIFADAHSRGSVLAYITGLVWRGWVELRRGNLAAAATDERSAVELAAQHELWFAVPWAQAFLAESLLEQGQVGPAAEVAEAMRLDGAIEQLLGMALYVRGRVRLSSGRRDDGLADLAASGEEHERIGVHNPNIVPWRPALAVAAGRGSDRAESLMEIELDRARRCGHARALGVALRARGLLEEPEDGVATLYEAVRVLGDSPARLEHARALQSLGGALRRQGRRREAREPLLQALDLADRMGAEGLAREAREELLAAGGRPRRRRLTGAESLTPTERRVAGMALGGMSNNDIAQALFVSHKTVEMHLGNAYRKLEIHSRAELAGALGESAEITG